MSSPSPLFAPRASKDQVEEGAVLAPRFDENGLIPAIATDHQTGEVLMVAYMNAESLAKTIELGEAVYWSRSRKELWHKGATSGHVQKVKQLLVDCDQDALVMKVQALGEGSCHVGYRSCFYREAPVGDAARGLTGPLPLSFTEGEKAYDPEKVYGKK